MQYSEFVTRELSNDNHHACGLCQAQYSLRGGLSAKGPVSLHKSCALIGSLHPPLGPVQCGFLWGRHLRIDSWPRAPGSVWRLRSLELSTVRLETIHRHRPPLSSSLEIASRYWVTIRRNKVLYVLILLIYLCITYLICFWKILWKTSLKIIYD